MFGCNGKGRAARHSILTFGLAFGKRDGKMGETDLDLLPIACILCIV